MDRKTVDVRGAAVAELPAALSDALGQTDDHRSPAERVQLGETLDDASSQRDGPSVARHSGDGFDVIVAEQYYLRTNSELQTTVIVERRAADRASVTVITGGGATGHGPTRWDLGSEASQIDAVVSALEDVCDQLGLSIDSAER
ncbi:hypothetical protein [Halomicrobium salinisoli]|uniref:hypothetical protein n=1 Tax=Halomicrobium salinisoli TaxID=2878391 RepID=UPI001CF03C3E|nr:hypothetical protein [Halomicrobium salinisoli]